MIFDHDAGNLSPASVELIHACVDNFRPGQGIPVSLFQKLLGLMASPVIIYKSPRWVAFMFPVQAGIACLTLGLYAGMSECGSRLPVETGTETWGMDTSPACGGDNLAQAWRTKVDLFALVELTHCLVCFSLTVPAP